MSIKEVLSNQPAHINKSRGMAEEIFKESPEIQLEMLREIKDNLVKRWDLKLTRIKEV